MRAVLSAGGGDALLELSELFELSVAKDEVSCGPKHSRHSGGSLIVFVYERVGKFFDFEGSCREQWEQDVH